MARILNHHPVLLLLVPFLSSLILGPPALLLWTGGAALRFSLSDEFRPDAAMRALTALLMCAAGLFAERELNPEPVGPRLILFEGVVTDGPWPDRMYPGTFRMTVIPVDKGESRATARGLCAVITGVPARRVKPGVHVVFPCEAVLGRNGIVLRTRQALIETTGERHGPLLTRHVYILRREMKACLQRSLSSRTASFCASILLGIPRSVGIDTRDLFRRTGTMHLLSISGLHVGIILVMVSALLNLFNLRWTTNALLQVFALACLCLITGGRVPVVRAALTGGCFIASNFLGRASRSSVFLIDAAFVIVILYPEACREISFQLSFAGYASILLFLQRVRLNRFPIPALLRRTAQAFGISCSAWCGTAPLAAYYFGTVVPFAPLVNCVAVPLFGLLLWAGLCHLLIALLLPVPAVLTAVVVERLYSMLLSVLEWSAATLPGPITTPPPPWWMLAVWYTALAAALIVPASNGSRLSEEEEKEGVTP